MTLIYAIPWAAWGPSGPSNEVLPLSHLFCIHLSLRPGATGEEKELAMSCSGFLTSIQAVWELVGLVSWDLSRASKCHVEENPQVLQTQYNLPPMSKYNYYSSTCLYLKLQCCGYTTFQLLLNKRRQCVSHLACQLHASTIRILLDVLLQPLDKKWSSTDSVSWNELISLHTVVLKQIR